MTLRIATWNMNDEGLLSPEHLLKLLLDPGHNPHTGVGTKKLDPIDIIVLQEVPLTSDYDRRLRGEIKQARTKDPSVKNYKVSNIANSITRGDQLVVEIELKLRRAPRTEILRGAPASDDGYMVVYDADKLTLIEPKMPIAVRSHHTLRYSKPPLRDTFREALVELAAQDEKIASGDRVKAFFNRRPWYLRLKWGAEHVHIYTWHAPPPTGRYRHPENV